MKRRLFVALLATAAAAAPLYADAIVSSFHIDGFDLTSTIAAVVAFLIPIASHDVVKDKKNGKDIVLPKSLVPRLFILLGAIPEPLMANKWVAYSCAVIGAATIYFLPTL